MFPAARAALANPHALGGAQGMEGWHTATEQERVVAAEANFAECVTEHGKQTPLRQQAVGLKLQGHGH